MAKKKPLNTTPRYYVYYNKKSGKILSIGNERDDSYEYGIEATWPEVEKLIDGSWSFNDYLVGYKRQPDGSSVLAVVPNTEHGYIFKNNIFEWITDNNEKAECIVAWNGPSECWEFSLNDSVKAVYSDSLLIPKLVFFVTLETDFDFLIRTIFVDSVDLISSKQISVPFTTKIEKRIDKISISSKLVFKTYGLKINE
jgi:hypothetical protein